MSNNATPNLDQLSEDMLNMVSSLVYGAIALDGIATEYILDLLDEIEEDKALYRHTVKRAVTNTKKGMQRIRCELAIRIRNKQDVYFVNDFSNILYKQIEKDIILLQTSIANALARGGHEEPMFKAKVLTAIALCDTTTCYIEENVHRIGSRAVSSMRNGRIIDIHKTLEPLRMLDVVHNLMVIKNFVCDRGAAPDVDLNNDHNCRLAANIIVNKMCDYERLKNALQQATEMRIRADIEAGRTTKLSA